VVIKPGVAARRLSNARSIRRNSARERGAGNQPLRGGADHALRVLLSDGTTLFFGEFSFFALSGWNLALLRISFHRKMK